MLNSTDKLFEKHSSKPYNPKLANVFFKSGMIEAWGGGLDKIREACAKYNGRLPQYNISAYLKLRKLKMTLSDKPKQKSKVLFLRNFLVHYPVQSEQDDEQDMHLGKVAIRYTRVANWIEWEISMTEHRMKEIWSSKKLT